MNVMLKKNSGNELRIIGGRWRARRIRFPPLQDIRPTPDRVRETLFNWLQHQVPGSRCLDLFAGSGAIGLEALSRGAAQVVFVDRHRAVARHLRATLQQLGAQNAAVYAQDAHLFLHDRPNQQFDIVFLDPPFSNTDLPEICRRLEDGEWLADPAYIYMEAAFRTGIPGLPRNWLLLKSERAGAVGYHLACRQALAAGELK